MNWYIPLGDFAPVAIPLLVLALAWAIILREQRRRRLAAAAKGATEGAAPDGPVRQPLPLSREVLEHFRAMGPGWKARIDEVLKGHVREEQDRARRRMAEPSEATKARVAEEREAFRGEGEEEGR